MEIEMATTRQLSELTGLKPDVILMLVHRGILPPGEKRGKERYLPLWECYELISAHKPGEHWVKGRERLGARRKAAPKAVTIEDLI